ncbi:MAG: hypothetical protein U0228_22505 [Myxococcaceae bacterium]
MTPTPAAPTAPVAPPKTWGFALLAAAALLGALPLGMTAFVVFAQRHAVEDEFAGLERNQVSEAFAMGGWPMYAVLGGGLFVSLVAAVFLVFAARSNALFAVPLPLFIAMPAALGAAGTSQGMRGSLEAVVHAAPADRATILAGSLGEALWCTTLGACVSLGVGLAAAAGLLFAGLAQRRHAAPTHARGLFAASALAAAMGVLAWFGASSAEYTSGIWTAIAHVQGELGDLTTAAADATRAQSAAAIATLVVLVLMGVATALLGAPAPARVAFAVSLLLGIGLLGVSVRAKPSKAVTEALQAGASSRPLYVFAAPRAGVTEGIPLGAAPNDSVEELIKQARELHEAAGDYLPEQVAFELTPEVSAVALRAALEGAAKKGVREVTLLTSAPDAPATALPAPFDALARGAHGVEVQLLFRDGDCPCDELTLSDTGVRLGDEQWKFEPYAVGKWADRYARPVTLRLDDALTVDALLKSAIAAMNHERPLGVVLEGAPPEGVMPLGGTDSALDEYRPPEPRADAKVLEVKVQGPLPLAEAQRQLSVERVGECVEEGDTLPATVEVELALSKYGRLLGSAPVGEDDLANCVSQAIDFGELDDPVRGMSIVRVKVKLTARPAADAGTPKRP